MEDAPNGVGGLKGILVVTVVVAANVVFGAETGCAANVDVLGIAPNETDAAG